jgi:hypothetical protein
MIDKLGRKWTPEVDVVTVGLVRKALGMNILEVLVPGSSLIETLSDPCTMVDVLYVLCEGQHAGVTDVNFGHAMTPESIEAGWKETFQGIVNFSPSATRVAHQKVLEKATALETIQAEQIRKMVESPEFDKILEAEMSKHLQTQEKLPTPGTGDVSSLPDSSESTPDGTP